MFSAKQLTEEQVSALQTWVAEGAQLPDLQKRLKETFDLNVTYMDMRFVVLDLGLELQSQVEEVVEDDEPEVKEPLVGTGEVDVSVDGITRPGAMVSGKVTFSDGETGVWMIDTMGQPSLDPDTAGYRPSQEDIMAFQEKLKAALSEGGGLGY